MDKRYDRSYFDTWYRQRGIGDPKRLPRKVALAVATAEYHLERPIRTVLDLGCGGGAGPAPLLNLRPQLPYPASDGSEYAITPYGRARNLHLARFADFPCCVRAHRSTCWCAATCCTT